MGGTTAFLYNDEFLKYQFGPRHSFQPIREKLTLDTVDLLGLFNDASVKLIESGRVPEDILRFVHTSAHIDLVKRLSNEGHGLLDQGDTPATKGLFEGSLSAVGASVQGALGIIDGEFDHAFNPAGGLHHAHPDRSSGFCVFNDIAVAVRALQRLRGLHRIAVIDIDGHHGNGTQDIFYDEKILTISLHRYGEGFYPGTGEISEIGEGEGLGFNINVPLPANTDDRTYIEAYRSIIVPALEFYCPEIIIHQFGVDGYRSDPLVGLGLTTKCYEDVSRLTHDFAHELCDGRYLVLGGGGYNIDAVRRVWSLMFRILSGSGNVSIERLEELRDKGNDVMDPCISSEVKETVRLLEDGSLPLLESRTRNFA